MRRITIEESLALRKVPRPVELSGVELEPAVKLLDRNGVLSLHPHHFASFAADGSSIRIAIELSDGSTEEFEASNCPETHICGFLRDAVATGLLERIPETCELQIGPCDGSSCQPCVEWQSKSEPLPDACRELIDPLSCGDFVRGLPVPGIDGGVLQLQRDE